MSKGTGTFEREASWGERKAAGEQKNEEKTDGFLQRSKEAMQTKTRKLRGSEGT